MYEELSGLEEVSALLLSDIPVVCHMTRPTAAARSVLPAAENGNSAGREYASVAVDERALGVWNLPGFRLASQLHDGFDNEVERRGLPWGSKR